MIKSETMRTITMFKRCLSFKPHYFSENLAHNEVFINRLRRFNRYHDKLSTTETQQLLVDCITSCRSLQRHKSYNQPQDMLNLRATSNQRLETMVWTTLINHQTSLNDDIIRSYLLTTPRPINASHIIDIITTDFHNKLAAGDLDYSMIRLAMGRLLDMGDYWHCFSLLDKTLRSPGYQQFMDNKIKSTVLLGSIAMVTSNLWFIWLSELPWELITGTTTVYGALLAIGFIKIKYPTTIGRLSWRLSNSVKYNIINYQELQLLNRMVHYFEEYNEVNLLNYHYSKIRTFNDLTVNKLDDYIIEEAPSSPPSVPSILSMHDDNFFHSNHHAVSEMYDYFKYQFKQRKIAINDLPTELQFMEYWQYNEHFEWVEPDQDPGELINLIHPKSDDAR